MFDFSSKVIATRTSLLLVLAVLSTCSSQNCKAILKKAWKISSFERDKDKYKLLAKRCTQAINKYFTAKELEMVRKSNLGSFYNFVNNKLNCTQKMQSIKRADGTFIDESL